MNSDRIVQLRERLVKAREGYYNQGEVDLTDAEFDVLEEELRGLSPEDSYFRDVGISVSGSLWKKRNHPIVMGGLRKVKGVEGLKIWWVAIEKVLRGEK